MNRKESSTSDKSTEMLGTKQVPAVSKGGHPQELGDSQLMQNILLIWLDDKLNEDSSVCLHTITQLRRVVNTVHSFIDSDECANFLRTIRNEYVWMIVSGTLGKHIVPCVSDMPQVVSIFIFHDNQHDHEQWMKEWPKIKGVFAEVTQICEALKQEIVQYEHDAVSIRFMSTTNDIHKDKLDCSFMYTQLMKDALLEADFKEEHIQQFIKYCRSQFVNNDHELRTVAELERGYHEHSPIWWYTSKSFLYSMVNRALRTMDVDMIVTMGFFVTDLHRQIIELHSQQLIEQNTRSQITLYRGQGVSESDFDQLMKTKGGLMAFNNFLSTSKKRRVSLRFVRRTLSNTAMVGILFVMTIDLPQSTTPFASVADVGFYGNKQEEILLSMHSVFRIQDIKAIAENKRLFQVDLIFTGETDRDLQLLIEHVKKETKWFSGWDRLSELLLKMGQFKKAEEVCQARLDRTTIELEKGPLYHQLGWIKSNLGEYSAALKLYEKSLETNHKILPSDHFSLAPTYNNMGDVYSKMGDYSKALFYYEKDLTISQKSLPPNHPDLGTSYSNMGSIYRDTGEYSKALFYSQKALEIQKQSLPPNHPNLGTSYENIGAIHQNNGEYSQALRYYEKSLEIKKQSLPSDHPNLAYCYDSMGTIYAEMNEQVKALSFLEQALEIRKQKLPSNHPDLSISYSNIGSVYCNNDEYSKALSCFLKSLEIQQQSLPPNHPDLGKVYNNIAGVYLMTYKYLDAKAYYEKALEIQQQTLPPNHPGLGITYSNLAMMYENINDYSKALSFYQRASDIMKQSLPSNHPQLQTVREHFERVKRNVN